MKVLNTTFLILVLIQQNSPMSIKTCLSRGGGADCTKDDLCVLLPTSNPRGGKVCVPANSPPVLNNPADISDPEIELLKTIVSSISHIDLGDRFDKELREMYAPLVYYVNRKLRSEVAGMTGNIPWGTLADRLATMVHEELTHSTCVLCFYELNDENNQQSVMFPSCCGGQQAFHKKCFRRAIRTSGTCPSCRANISMETLREEEEAAVHLELALRPLPSRTLHISLAALNNQRRRCVDKLNRWWEIAKQESREETQRVLRGDRELQLQENLRHDLGREIDLGHDPDGRLFERWDTIDAEINQRRNQIRIERESLGLVTVGPSGDLELTTRMKFIYFFIMAFVVSKLINLS
ncbi:unnamed protein product [Ectocarpus sp. 4 AP-2014]|uniref:EsV-1-208 n=1 Tax=Ectocarpus siliculosus virus 1 (isolate New Zealand/Kaikoura/1988) TaxID=654926 RepID=Q8QKU6_ESV1K|nr:EsV-1-208 [Ectocarpus siliculosus virus 1]AAK14622.1 EsV-1-208 [Ectocarpus siliculosus virus 1]